MFGNINGLAARQPRLELLSKNSAAGKPANELHADFRTTVSTALIDRNLGHEVAISSGDRQALVDARQDLLPVGDAAPVPRLLGRTRSGQFSDIQGDIHVLSISSFATPERQKSPGRENRSLLAPRRLTRRRQPADGGGIDPEFPCP